MTCHLVAPTYRLAHSAQKGPNPLKIVTLPIYFLNTHILLKFQPERTKIPKAPYITSFWTLFRPKTSKKARTRSKLLHCLFTF